MTGVARVLEGRPRDLGGLGVSRVLPARGLRTVGPFIFFDHMGPVVLAPGGGVDVPPHPHIGLATVTYLFEGELLHRDSLGSTQVIRPGDVNWMVAGRGIVHSERTPPAMRQAACGVPIHGIQTWIALPRPHEECEPSFAHHPARTLPEIRAGGALLRLLVGEAFSARAPAAVFAPMFYVDTLLEAGALVTLAPEHGERAAYVVKGEIEVGNVQCGAGQMLLADADADLTVRARGPARLMLLGGAPIDGPRHVWWNFVSSSAERIERAKLDWRENRFAPVPGDDGRVPLPAA